MRKLITTLAVVTSLALAGTSALAANANVHKVAKPHAVHAQTHIVKSRVAARHVAPGPRYAGGPRGLDIGQFVQSFFGGGWNGWPGVNVKMARSAARGHGTYEWSGSSPTYDSSPAVDSSSDAYTAAAQAQDAVNQMDLQNSMQAAQEQNDAANAAFTAGILAAQQTEINANN